MSTVIDQPSRAAQPMMANRRYRVAAQDLQLNMFVVELDRPWLDTPFLLQGFLIDDQVELDTLTRYCHYVYVDLELSSPGVAMAIRIADANFGRRQHDVKPLLRPFGAGGAQADAQMHHASALARTVIHAAAETRPEKPETAPVVDPVERKTQLTRERSASRRALEPEGKPPTVIAAAPRATPQRRYKPRTDARVSRETRDRFRNMLRQSASNGNEAPGMLERMLHWFSDQLPLGRVTEQQRKIHRQFPELRKADIRLTQHNIRHPMEAELPRAKEAFKSSESALNELIDNIRNGQIPDMEAIASSVDGMVDSMLDNPDAMMWTARLREEDIHVYHHGVRVALYLVALGRHLGFPKRELSWLGQIGMLADVGKTKIPRSLLEKPGLLSASEFALVKEHVNLSLHILGSGPALPMQVMQGIGQHHERIDGSGYPNQLKGDKISIYGKMAAIADSFAALITPRPYAKASSPQDALMNLYEWSGTSFHEPMVEQFVQAIGVFPVGSLVELRSGEVAVVLAHNRIRRLEPRVLILSAPDKTPLEKPVERDLYQESKNARRGQSRSLRILRGLSAGTYGFNLQDYYLDEVPTQHASNAQSTPDAQ